MSGEFQCLACGAGGLGDLGRNEDFPECRVLHCRACGMVSTYPTPDDATLSELYSTSYSETNRSRCSDFAMYDIRAKAQVEAVLRSGLFEGRGGAEPFAGLHMLDIGCGPGSLLVEFQRLGARVRGYDADPAVADAARSRLGEGAEVRARLFDPDAHDPGSFDVITLSHVLEHVTHPDAFVAKLLRLLRPGGCLFVEVPNHSLRRVRQFLHRSYRGSGHVNFFNRRSLAKLAASSGGRVVLTETAGPELASTEVPYGSARSSIRRGALRLERAFLGRLARLGLRKAPLKSARDWPARGQPEHIEGLYLRSVMAPAGSPVVRELGLSEAGAAN